MERVRETSTVKILFALYEHGDLYTEELARKAELSLRHTKRVLPNIIREKLIEQYQKKNKNYYKLTEKGEAIAWGLVNPDALVDLCEKEETARAVKVEAPLLSAFCEQILSLMNKEEEVLENVGKEKIISSKWNQQISEIRRGERRLDKEFERRKRDLQKEMGLVTEIPHLASFRGLESFEDLVAGVSYRKQEDFAEEVELSLNKISSLKETRDKLKLAIKGLKKLRKKELIDRDKYIERKSRYERELRIVEDFLEKVKDLP